MVEIWKPIRGYEGLYQVSNLGNVKSLIKWRGTLSRILKPSTDNDGYRHVNLCKSKIQTTFLVHRLGAVEFLPNPNNLPEVNHKNGIKSDNNITNLEWITSSKNQKHAYSNGLKIAKSGKEHWRSKTIIRLTADYKEVDRYDSANKASIKLNYNLGCICKAARENKIAYGFIWVYEI